MRVNRITNDLISNLNENEIFVFGSNLSGIHGAGAARTALQWGAIYGNPVGIQGKTYAIPTKDKTVMRTLTINEIKPFVDDFIEWAKYNTGNIFLVTEIGCGLAGLKHSEVAPLFKDVIEMENVFLPLKFWEILDKE